MDDERTNNQPEEDQLRPAPLTFREKFFLGALMAVTGLWVVLLMKIGGWVVWLVKGI